MTTERAYKNAQRIAGLIDAGKLSESDALKKIGQIVAERNPNSPRPELGASLHLRDIKKMAQDGRVPLHLGRFLQSPQMTAWVEQLAPLHDAVLAQQAGQNAADAVRSPVTGGQSAPPPARFIRKTGGMAP